MIEQTALAYVNMWGVLGSLEKLCEIDDIAKAYLAELKVPVSLCFSVKDGPTNTLHFSNSGCRMTEGDSGCNRKMSFSSPEAFNRMINEGKPGMPTKNIIGTLAFLAGTFTRLTDRLRTVLRAEPAVLKQNAAFLQENTVMTMYVLGGTISALANYDSISNISAAETVDGEISLAIRDTAFVTLTVKEHIFATEYKKAENPRAVLEFSNVELAYDIFSGTASFIDEMCKGNLYLAGMLSMVDNVSRIMNRAEVYLA